VDALMKKIAQCGAKNRQKTLLPRHRATPTPRACFADVPHIASGTFQNIHRRHVGRVPIRRFDTFSKRQKGEQNHTVTNKLLAAVNRFTR
jgi:hypothetical protein